MTTRKDFAGSEGKPGVGAKSAAVTRTATKARPARKSLSDYITERFDDFSRSQKDVARYIVDHLDEAAFQTAEELARRANTSSSTVVRFSQALGFEGYPELQQSAIEEYRLKVAEGAAGSNGNASGGAAALFNFDHSEFEASLGADYSNIEETARSLTREQVEASVSAIATSRRVLIVGTDQMAFFASYLRHLLGLLDVRAEIVSSASQDNIQKLSRMDDDTLLVALTAGRANPLVLRALKLARHRRVTDDVDHRRHPFRRRRALRARPLLLVERPQLHPLERGPDGPGPGTGARRVRAGRGGAPGPDPRFQAQVGLRTSTPQVGVHARPITRGSGPCRQIASGGRSTPLYAAVRFDAPQNENRPGGRSGPASRYAGPRGSRPVLLSFERATPTLSQTSQACAGIG